MKIYAITKGEYSAYHICAITVDREKAEKLAEIFSDDYYDAEIEEYEDGKFEELNLYWFYNAELDLIEVIDYVGEDDNDRVVVDKTGDFGAYVFAPDAEHARKKAQDMIAKYKAEQAGL